MLSCIFGAAVCSEDILNDKEISESSLVIEVQDKAIAQEETEKFFLHEKEDRNSTLKEYEEKMRHIEQNLDKFDETKQAEIKKFQQEFANFKALSDKYHDFQIALSKFDTKIDDGTDVALVLIDLYEKLFANIVGKTFAYYDSVNDKN